MKQDQAEVIAIQALTFIGQDERALNAFMAQSGASPDNLRHMITEPDFLGGILDFLLSDEANLLNFCQDNELDPHLVIRARRALPGGENLWDG